MSAGSGWFLVVMALASAPDAQELQVREAYTECKSGPGCTLRLRVTADWPDRQDEAQAVKLVCEALGPDQRILGAHGTYAWLKQGRLDERLEIALPRAQKSVPELRCDTSLP